MSGFGGVDPQLLPPVPGGSDSLLGTPRLGGSPPQRMVIDFLDGILSKKDAISFARGFIESHFDVPSVSGFHVIRLETGYAYEAQEGGSGRAFLPNIVKELASNPGAIAIIRVGSRILQVTISNEGKHSAVLLPEGVEPQGANVVEIEPGPTLTPYESKGAGWLFTGFAFFSIGIISFLVGVILLSVAYVSNQSMGTDISNLPVRKWDELYKKLTEMRAGNRDSQAYIAALKFDGSGWSIVPGGQDSGKPAVPAAPENIVEQ